VVETATAAVGVGAGSVAASGLFSVVVVATGAIGNVQADNVSKSSSAARIKDGGKVSHLRPEKIFITLALYLLLIEQISAAVRSGRVYPFSVSLIGTTIRTQRRSTQRLEGLCTSSISDLSVEDYRNTSTNAMKRIP
jgi:hypothetical protein